MFLLPISRIQERKVQVILNELEKHICIDQLTPSEVTADGQKDCSDEDTVRDFCADPNTFINKQKIEKNLIIYSFVIS
jgi:hypothetical protein